MNKAKSFQSPNINRIRNKKAAKRKLMLGQILNEKDEIVKQDLRNMGIAEEYIKRAFKLLRVKYISFIWYVHVCD